MTLRELQYLRTFDENLIEENKEILSFACFNDIDSIFPLLNLRDKGKVFSLLMQAGNLSFIPTFSIQNLEVEIPEDINFTMVKTLKIDDYNLNQFILKYENFPNIENLCIHSGVEIHFPFSTIKNLKTISLYNVNFDKRLFNLPDLSKTSPSLLRLMRYRCCFAGRLPEEVHFEECYIEESSNLEGCRKMTLLSTVWYTPSMPTEELILEDVRYSMSPKHLKKLSMDSSMINVYIHEIENLEELKIINHNYKDNDCLLSFPQSLKKLIIDYEHVMVKNLSFNENLRHLTFRGPKEVTNVQMIFPYNLQSLVIYTSVLSLEALVRNLPPNLESLRMKNCTFRAVEFHSEKRTVLFKSSLKNIEIINCNDEENLFLSYSNEIQSVLIVSSKVNTSEKENVINTKTNIPLLSEEEFARLCDRNSKEEYFKNYTWYIDDFLNLNSKTDKYKNYEKIFHKFPYGIQTLAHYTHIQNFLRHSNPMSFVLLNGRKWFKKDIIASIESDNVHPNVEKFVSMQ